MPISFKLEPSLSLVLTTASGDVTDEDILQHLQRLRALYRETPYIRELADLREASIQNVTTSAVRRAAEAWRADEALGDLRVAFVVSEDVMFGMSRMYELMRGESTEEVRVFRELAEAREWLDIP